MQKCEFQGCELNFLSVSVSYWHFFPLSFFQGQFPEMRKKIEKRGRKLIDYDKERHAIQQMQTSAGRNEAKFAR